MNNSTLDEHIKKQFANYTPEVPPHVWEKIVAGKERKRPAGFWFTFFSTNGWILLAAVLLVGGGVLMYRKSFSNKPVIAKEKIFQKDTYTIDGPGANQPTIKKDEPSTTNTAGGLEKNDGEKTNFSLPNTIVNQKIAITTDGASKQTNKLAATTSLKKQFNVRNNGKVYSKAKTSMASESPEAYPEETETTAVEASTTDELLQYSILNFNLLGKTKKELSVTSITNPSIMIPCPKGERQPGSRYLEIYGGPDYAFRSMTDTGNSVYLAKRKESSHFSSAFSAGLRYTKIFANGMSFRTGINYSQINEKFKYSQGNIIQVVYITNSNGDTTGSFTTSGTRYKNTFNKFRSIDIPLLAGYEVGSGRLRVNFNAGAIINIYSWQKGDVLDTAYKPVNITTGKESSPYQFRTNTGVGFLGSVSLYYKLSARLHLLAEPYFRYNLSPASKSELTLKQKYHTAGLRLGLRIDF